MDIEYLKDYHAKENERLNKFLDIQFKGNSNISYPNNNRFHKLKQPVGRASYTCDSIWPQIPLYGSLIIGICPIAESLFYKAHGFEKKDFEKLIDFSKDTGKVQFLINGNPEEYVGLDFLSLLFEELHPPISYKLQQNYLLNNKNYYTEYDALVRLPSQNGMNFIDSQKSIAGFGATRYNLNDMSDETFFYYAFLKEFGYNEIIEYFENLLVLDSLKAFNFLAGIGALIVEPKIDAYKSDHIYSFEDLTKLSCGSNIESMGGTNNIHEIGEFLLNKLTFMPESFDACKDVIARYDQEDLYKVSASLHKGVNESNPDIICKNNIELSEILENVWSDAKLENRIKDVNYGIPISMALVGTLASGVLSGGVGLLAGLGLTGVSEIINQESIGETLVKKTVPNHIVNIFDFKKKYNVY